MRLVQLRIFSGDTSVEGDVVFVAPDNVGAVCIFLSDPPAAEVHLKTGPASLVVDGSAERVAALLAEGKVDRLDALSRGLDDSRLVDFRGPPPPSQRCSWNA